MKITPEILLAYVNKELDQAQHDMVELSAENDQQLKQQLQCLESSKLPYKAAFDDQATPEMPQDLRNYVETLTSISADKGVNLSYSKRGFLVASVVFAFILGFFTQSGFDLLYPEAEHQKWARSVANYHALYVRETVDNNQLLTPEKVNISMVLDQHIGMDNTRLSANISGVIPDLSAAGYKFVRAQHLGYFDEPLVQLVYLKDEGKPLALCFMIDNGATFERYEQGFDLLNAIVWRESGLRFILVGQEPLAELQSIEQSISI